MRDLARMQRDPPEGISASPIQDNLMVWHGVIMGPRETPYEDGIFRLTLTFDDTYPSRPPKVRFTSKMCHPNIYEDGSVCVDILKDRWTSAYDVATLLISIQSLLAEAYPRHLNHDKSKMKEVRRTVALSLREID